MCLEPVKVVQILDFRIAAANVIVRCEKKTNIKIQSC